MRLLVLLLLLTYAAAHPAAVHTLVALGAHALPALRHLGFSACSPQTAHTVVIAGPPLSSHWNMATLGRHWNVGPLGSHWNSRAA